ncbi:MAG: RNA polymerase sigma factor [Candidatus Omnitrophica bacterium]|nr:RNA polymerase sigma factor [Candidatus Omnitrophota bacterium]
MQDLPRDILIRASQGDIEAFKEIYKATSGFVYTLALRITNNIEDAQEVTQDVFLKIYKNLKSFQFRSSFKTWIYRITANTAINAYKRKSKEILHKGDYEITIKTESAPNETTEIIDKEQKEQLLRSLLDMLNPDQRACITLREIEGLNYKEISKALKININTVRSRLKRAREALLTYRKKEVMGDEL